MSIHAYRRFSTSSCAQSEFSLACASDIVWVSLPPFRALPPPPSLHISLSASATVCLSAYVSVCVCLFVS